MGYLNVACVLGVCGVMAFFLGGIIVLWLRGKRICSPGTHAEALRRKGYASERAQGLRANMAGPGCYFLCALNFA